MFLAFGVTIFVLCRFLSFEVEGNCERVELYEIFNIFVQRECTKRFDKQRRSNLASSTWFCERQHDIRRIEYHTWTENS